MKAIFIDFFTIILDLYSVYFIKNATNIQHLSNEWRRHKYKATNNVQSVTKHLAIWKDMKCITLLHVVYGSHRASVGGGKSAILCLSKVKVIPSSYQPYSDTTLQNWIASSQVFFAGLKNVIIVTGSNGMTKNSHQFSLIQFDFVGYS